VVGAKRAAAGKKGTAEKGLVKKKSSVSKQFLGAAKGGLETRKRLRREGTIVDMLMEEKEHEDEEHFVPSILTKGAENYVKAMSQHDKAIKEAQQKRQGTTKGEKRPKRPLDKLVPACWAFYREAEGGESRDFVYCRAAGFKSQHLCTDYRMRIAKGYNSSNAKSHVVNKHPDWWAAVDAAAQNGKNARKTLQALTDADAPRPLQRQIAVVKLKKPGQLAKELALASWMIRNKIAFNTLDDKVGFNPMLDAWDVTIRGADSIRALSFPMHEVALISHARGGAASNNSATPRCWSIFHHIGLLDSDQWQQIPCHHLPLD
jgi:hypothetical protein